MASVKFDVSSIYVPPVSEETKPARLDNADLLDLAYQAGLLPECRRSPRHKLRIRINATPLDAAGQPEGELFQAESINISATGICLISAEPVTAKHLLVEIPGALSQVERVAVEVVRCTQAGDRYEIAGQFVSFPSASTDESTANNPRV